MEYLTSDKMYEIDDYTINEVGILSAVLMERAALSLVNGIEEKGLVAGRKILVIAGPGNNGADGIAIARMLHLKGCKVQLYLLNPDHQGVEFIRQKGIAEKVCVPVAHNINSSLDESDLVIDAIFGIGVKGEIKGEYKEIIDLINQSKKLVISCDIPSGLSATTGQALNVVVQADYTYTFGYKKRSMETQLGQLKCGELVVSDIGYPKKLIKENLLS